ncbi:MAG: hypothetical protein M3347_14990, partial [Armatimonadota bacterium]|nr:hypothetical protein [Armatimonadota bacterium]
GNSYAANGCMFTGPGGVKDGNSLAVYESPASWMLLSEEATYPTKSPPADSTDDGYLSLDPVDNPVSSRHLGGSNVTFLDGHVKWLEEKNNITSNIRSGSKLVGAPFGIYGTSSTCF